MMLWTLVNWKTSLQMKRIRTEGKANGLFSHEYSRISVYYHSNEKVLGRGKCKTLHCTLIKHNMASET